MSRYTMPGSGGFLGTLNRLSGSVPNTPADGEQTKRMVLQRLKDGPTDLRGLAEMSLPMSAVEIAIAELRDIGMVEAVSGTNDTYRLTDYAEKALSYIVPA